MTTKIKIALATMLLAGSASLAAAQEFDPNLLNRYPGYNGSVEAARVHVYRDVALSKDRQATITGKQLWIDRASAQWGL